MTNEQILKTIESIRPNISKLAFVFIHKMKQPSIYTVQDLLQEGEEIVIRQINSGRFDKTKGKLSTYLIRSVISRFIDIMHYTYKSDPSIIESRKKEMRKIDFPRISELSVLLHIMKILSSREKQYLSIMINPPEKIKMELAGNRKIVRKLVRETLDMSAEEEREIRKEIKRKLKTRTELKN